MRKFLILFFLPVLSHAQIQSNANEALQAMNVPAGAKATALGGAFSSLADDSNALFWNPAGMAFLQQPEIQTTYNKWFLDTFFQDVSGVVPMDWGAFGGRVSYINFGSFDTRNEFGSLQGTTSPMAWGGDIGFAKRFDPIAFGISGKFYQEAYGNYSLSGFGMDAGALAHFENFRLSLGVRDIGNASNYSVPTNFYLGTSLSLGQSFSRFVFATDLTMASNQTIALHHGVEYGFHKFLYLRAGYQWEPQNAQAQDQVGFGGGFGVVLGNFLLDYSLVPYGELGLTQKFSVGYQFGDSPKKKTASNQKESSAPHDTPNSTEASIDSNVNN